MLDERPEAFDERNLVFHGLMGLLSASEKLHRVLEAESDVAEEPISQDDPWLLCVLGFVAFRLRLLGTLSTISTIEERIDGGARETRAPRPPVRSLLR